MREYFDPDDDDDDDDYDFDNDDRHEPGRDDNGFMWD